MAEWGSGLKTIPQGPKKVHLNATHRPEDSFSLRAGGVAPAPKSAELRHRCAPKGNDSLLAHTQASPTSPSRPSTTALSRDTKRMQARCEMESSHAKLTPRSGGKKVATPRMYVCQEPSPAAPQDCTNSQRFSCTPNRDTPQLLGMNEAATSKPTEFGSRFSSTPARGSENILSHEPRTACTPAAVSQRMNVHTPSETKDERLRFYVATQDKRSRLI
eukprot:NODE_6596_length_834_cov_113.549930_g6360_i0.p1 GENE.NODE_6596_length_834_cov_113.549930_g6360_i0~~NODE_6596_length_834_cov_113.549930_g6360_i0.p1  ORF type:complete len:236 (+),score=42.22 NODE_6596_length_834_cov_113.549930_g6360_i0:58-708(+)